MGVLLFDLGVLLADALVQQVDLRPEYVRAVRIVVAVVDVAMIHTVVDYNTRIVSPTVGLVANIDVSQPLSFALIKASFGAGIFFEPSHNCVIKALETPKYKAISFFKILLTSIND